MEQELCSREHSLRPVHVFKIQRPQSCSACYRLFSLELHVPFSSAFIRNCRLFGLNPSDTTLPLCCRHHTRLVLSLSILSENPTEHGLFVWSSLRNSHSIWPLVDLSLCCSYSQEHIMDDSLDANRIFMEMAGPTGEN